MKKLLMSALAVCILAGNVSAQTTKTTGTTKTTPKTNTTKPTTTTTTAKPVAKPVVPVKTPADILYDELLPSTAKIMFIDSIVVDKANFLAQIPLTEEDGILKFEGTKACYYNNFEFLKIYADDVVTDTITKRHIFMTNRDEDTWTKPTRRTELENNLSESDYPFMLADGTTFYFAGKGEASVGGYDIFKTTYDAEDMKFLEPHNMGMPYNSKANDYLLAINDIENIGWLVTDRFQPEGKVCIYTFEPTAQRKNLGDDVSKEVRQSFADIRCISDTWEFGDRDAALQRMAVIRERLTPKAPVERIEFVVNDDITYTSVSEFKSANGAETFRAITEEKNKLAEQQALLEKNRGQYQSVKGNDKATVTKNIGIIEKNINKLEASISKKEKQLRQAEISATK